MKIFKYMATLFLGCILLIVLDVAPKRYAWAIVAVIAIWRIIRFIRKKKAEKEGITS